MAREEQEQTPMDAASARSPPTSARRGVRPRRQPHRRRVRPRCVPASHTQPLILPWAGGIVIFDGFQLLPRDLSLSLPSSYRDGGHSGVGEMVSPQDLGEPVPLIC
jgi:hypothetical protein